jgi:V8-like Glu-specific endopeptidase
MSQLEYERELEAVPGRRRDWELFAAGAEYTVLGPSDDRVRVANTRVEPFRHVCKLEMVFRDPADGSLKNFIGTGTLVGPSKVLTAAHCIYDRDHGFGYAQSIRVIPGKNGAGRSSGAEPFGFALSRRLDVPAGWRTAATAAAARLVDYGVITVDRPIGRRSGLGWWRRIGHRPDAMLTTYRVNTSGYPGDKGGDQQWRVYDRVVRALTQRLEYVHDTFGGQSGSPIWIRWQQYRTIVGIHTNGDFTASGVNSGTRIIPAVLADIRRWLTR